MAFNPALPRTNAPIASAELRDQFNGLKTLLDELPTSNAMHNALVSQTEVTALADKRNELIDALNRSGRAAALLEGAPCPGQSVRPGP